MAGLRIYHPTARSGTFLVEHRKRPYRIPVLCAMCGRAHEVKTYHISVDHDGFAFVSYEVWAMLERYSPGLFQMANEVGNPPALHIGLGPGLVPRPQSIDERN